MKNRPISRAFTIIELLVVVSIIALLIGILLPAIGKARDNAKLTQSQANIKNVGTAMVSYGAEFNDRQPTWLDDNFSRYGNSFDSAWSAYAPAFESGVINKYHCIGQNDQMTVYYWAGAARRYEPFNMAEKVGTFRLWHCRPMNAYVNGRVYDPTFYAPKDTVTLAAVETTAFENAGEWYDMGQNSGGATKFIYSSYCMSPAAMYSPNVFSKNISNQGKYWTDPYTMEAGHRSPAAGQAQYSSNKTWIMEHNWLQQRRNQICNPFITGSQLDCEPYYFNAVNNSSPVTFFFDGSIRPAGVGDAISADERVLAQTQNEHGLWSRDTPLEANGYFIAQNYEPWTQTSYHILTIDGIKGRDFIR